MTESSTRVRNIVTFTSSSGANKAYGVVLEDDGDWCRVFWDFQNVRNEKHPDVVESVKPPSISYITTRSLIPPSTLTFTDVGDKKTKFKCPDLNWLMSQTDFAGSIPAIMKAEYIGGHGLTTKVYRDYGGRTPEPHN